MTRSRAIRSRSRSIRDLGPPGDLPSQKDVPSLRGGPGRLKTHVYAAAGWAMVALGVIGVFLPVMPTTVFLILAAWFFSRSSPRFEAWLLDHPYLGPPVRKWRETGAIGVRAKALALAGMAFGYAIFWFAARPSPVLAIIVAAFLAGSALFVLTRPSA